MLARKNAALSLRSKFNSVQTAAQTAGKAREDALLLRDQMLNEVAGRGSDVLIEQINEFLGASGSGQVRDADLALLRQYAALNGTSYCRQACNDCDGACPYGVPIADVLRTRMYAVDYEDVEFARAEYAAIEGSAEACLSCSGAPCASACSHGLDIAAWCAPTHRMLA